MPHITLYPTSLIAPEQEAKECFLNTNQDWFNSANHELNEAVLFSDTGLPASYTAEESKDFSLTITLLPLHSYLLLTNDRETDEQAIVERVGHWKAYISLAKTLLFTYSKHCSVNLVAPVYDNSKLALLVKALVDATSEFAILNAEVSALANADEKAKGSETIATVLAAAFSTCEFQRRIDETSVKLKELTSQINDKDSQIELLNLQIAHMQEELEQSYGEIDQFKLKNINNQKAIAELEQRNHKCKTELKEALLKNSEVGEKDREIERLKLEMFKLQEELEQKVVSIHAHSSDNKSIISDEDVEALESNYELAQLQIAQLQEELEHYYNKALSKSDESANLTPSNEAEQELVVDVISHQSEASLSLISRLLTK